MIAVASLAFGSAALYAARTTYTARKKAAKATLHIAGLGDEKTVVTTVPTRSSVLPFTVDADNRRF